MTEHANSTTPEQTIHRYMGIWNERNAERRRAVIDELFAERCDYVDPKVAARGPAELDAFIGAVQTHYPGVVFSIAVAGVFINRKNVILLLMCIELMLLAVNFNFVAFSRFLGILDGQVFVFFILTVAAAEAAIGLAILVVLFRQRRSINVEELDAMKG